MVPRPLVRACARSMRIENTRLMTLVRNLESRFGQRPSEMDGPDLALSGSPLFCQK
jgi:hypothetical protein